jgi:hypothetical protein
MTTTIRHPDGALSTYTVTNPATWAALQAVKPARKPRGKADKRRFPHWHEFMSAEDYVRQYFALNSERASNGNNYGAHINHLALFQPLNTAHATWAPDTVEIETVEA